MRSLPEAQVRPRFAFDGNFYYQCIIFFAPLIFIFGLVFLKLDTNFQNEEGPLYWRLVAREDSPVEYLTSLVYLLAGWGALTVGRRFYQQRQHFYGHLYLLLALGFLFICLEEISWGQRIFGVASPEFFETHNVQSEINLHNFAGRYLLHTAYMVVGAYGAFAHLVMPKLVPARFKRAIPLFAPSAILFLYFFPILALYAYYDYGSDRLVALFGPQFGWEAGVGGGEHFMIGKDQEAVELILAVGFLLFAESARRAQNLGRFDNLPLPKFRQ